MPPLRITRYTPPLANGWLGTVEPKDRRWILFVYSEARAVLFMRRNPATGAAISRDP
jgi:hypothetical protein